MIEENKYLTQREQEELEDLKRKSQYTFGYKGDDLFYRISNLEKKAAKRKEIIEKDPDIGSIV